MKQQHTSMLAVVLAGAVVGALLGALIVWLIKMANPESFLNPDQNDVEGWVRKNNEKIRLKIDNELSRCRIVPGRGRGIVMCAGGKYLVHAYASLMTVRTFGCQLPVEIFYADKDEITGKAVAMFERDIGDVTFIDASQSNVGVQPTQLRGWEIKSYSLLLTSFDEILFLDADCGVMENPEVLFDEPGYHKYGNMFWPDYQYSNQLIRECLGRNFGPKYSPGFETESGQIVLRKTRCEKALVYTWLLNMHQSVFYKLYHGDKDLFRLGFNMAGTPFNQIKPVPGIVGFKDPHYGTILHAMVQKKPNGRPLFVHRTQKKYTMMKRHIWDDYVPISKHKNPVPPLVIYHYGFASCAEPYCQQRRTPPERMKKAGLIIDEAEMFAEEYLVMKI